MKKKIWDLYAPIYKQAMKSDQKIYDYMYRRIPKRAGYKPVLVRYPPYCGNTV